MTKKRILIVEDNPGIRKMTQLRLEHEGYDVVTAADGQAALEEAGAKLPIHLILLDIKLPKLNGYDVCQALKRRSATSGIPVIIFSASESELQHLADRCIEVGAIDWIRKPFRTQELLHKIHRALGEETEEKGGVSHG